MSAEGADAVSSPTFALFYRFHALEAPVSFQPPPPVPSALRVPEPACPVCATEPEMPVRLHAWGSSSSVLMGHLGVAALSPEFPG